MAPAQAIAGFAKKHGVAAEALQRRATEKGEVFVARVQVKGLALDRILPGLVEDALKALPIPKVMRWGAGDAQFVRPVHGLVMLHGAKVVPGKVLDVHYEDTVLDFEPQVRRILSHCGLPFEESCLRFHETVREVRTASSEQVREPLYARSLGAWRRYEGYLGPWQEELADVIAGLPDRVRQAGT